MTKEILFAVVLISGFASAGRAAQPPVITEFMARNAFAFADEDSEFPDWIEIFNPDETEVSMTDWYLTDDSRHTRRWRFPDVKIGPGRFLIVFASNKNRTDPAKPLHTDFELNNIEYLGLVGPGGVTTSEFGPDYPIQASDVSYGFPMTSQAQPLIPAGAAVKAMVPADDTLGTSWTAADFDDTGWTAGTTGVGYDTRSTPKYGPYIGLDIVAMKGANTSAYIRLPFEVTSPADMSTLHLNVKYEDGFVAYLNGTEVARRNAPAALAWNAKAGSSRTEANALNFEKIDLSRQLGLLQAGRNVLAIHGLNFSKTNSTFLCLPELHASSVISIDTSQKKFFTQPSPGAGNVGGEPGISEMPIFSKAEGTFDAPFDLTLTSPAPNAVIRYTTDRKKPTETSKEYTGPISISLNTVVRARAYQPGLLPSPMVTQTYISLDPTAMDVTSNLPLLVISTFGATPSEQSIPVNMQVINTTEGQATLSDVTDYSGNAIIKWRGSSSLQFPKKSYAVELNDDLGKELPAPLLGMPNESDWILYAPYTDKTLMRDVLAYEWSNVMGQWASHTVFCELYLTSGTKVKATDYQGVYVLIEKIKRGEDRVDIKNMYRSYDAEPEITGGYIFKKDRLDPGDSGFSTARGQQLAYVFPKEHAATPVQLWDEVTRPQVANEITPAQKAYVSGFFRDFETALYGANFKDPELGYAKYADVLSFIDAHILVELTKNIDGYRLSWFMFKDRGEKLKMGPAWDYNLTLGNANYLDGWKPDGWYYNLISDTDYPWYRRLQQDTAFTQAYAARWVELRESEFQIERLIASIEEKALLLQDAQERNYRKWPILGTYIWPNQFIGQTFDQEIDFMKKWLRDRVAWMDGQFITAPVVTPPSGTAAPGLQVTMSAPNGVIYYTLDRSDPRGADGKVGPTAIKYTGPVTIQENTRVRARVNIGAIWSAIKETTYVVSAPTLVITEIMFRPGTPPAGSPYAQDDYEFIEIQNIGETPASLNGVRFTTGLTYDFSTSAIQTLAPGGFVVVVRNLNAFNFLHPPAENIPVAGVYTNNLNDSGESLTLLGSLDEQIHKFTYAASWYPETAAGGKSLVVVNPKGPRELWGAKESWRASNADGGSPGRADSVGPGTGRQIPADLDQDGVLSLTDAIGVLNHLFVGTVPVLPCGDGTATDPANVKLLDLDGDQKIELNDAVYLLGYMFLAGPPPVLGTNCVDIAGCGDACPAS